MGHTGSTGSHVTNAIFVCFCRLCCFSHSFNNQSYLSFSPIYFPLPHLSFLLNFYRYDVTTPPSVLTSLFGSDNLSGRLCVTLKINDDNDKDKAWKTKPLGKQNRFDISVTFAPRLTSCQNCLCYVNIATTDGLLNGSTGKRAPEATVM